MSESNNNWNINVTVPWTWIAVIVAMLWWVTQLAAWFVDKFFDRLEGLL